MKVEVEKPLPLIPGQETGILHIDVCARAPKAAENSWSEPFMRSKQL